MGEQRRYKNQHVFLRGQAQRLNGPLAYQVIATPQTLSLISEQKSAKKPTGSCEMQLDAAGGDITL